MVQSYKNQPTDARVIVENKVTLFSGHSVHITVTGNQKVGLLVICWKLNVFGSR